MIAESIRAHFQAHQKRTKCAFFWRVSLEGLVAQLVLVYVVGLFVHLPSRTDFPGTQSWQLFADIVIFAPFFETLLFQALPTMIARACGLGFWGQVMSSLVPFAAVHFTINWGAGIFAGLITGFYVAFTYVHWRKESFSSALWMTVGMHALHNFILFQIGLITGGLK